jgi:hypothetical protein
MGLGRSDESAGRPALTILTSLLGWAAGETKSDEMRCGKHSAPQSSIWLTTRQMDASTEETAHVH